MPELFNPPKDPSVGSKPAVKFRVRKISYGDGYTEKAPHGLNSKTEMLTVVWQSLTAAEKDQITDFFDERRGAEAFRYTFPGQATEKLWTCEEYEPVEKPGGKFMVTAKFDRDYQP